MRMTTQIAPFAALVVSLFAITACATRSSRGDGGGVDGGADGSAGSPDGSVGRSTGLAHAVCAAADACFGGTVQGWMDTCVAWETILLEDTVVGQLDDGATGGRVVIDASAEPACFAAIAAAGCGLFAPGIASGVVPEVHLPAACNAAYRGTVALGAGCRSTVDCAGDAYCDGSDYGTCSPAICTARHAVGGACRTNAACASGLYCKSGGICAVQGDTGSACTSSDDCRVGLRCTGTMCAALASAPATAGATCSTSDGCAGGLVCTGSFGCQPRVPSGSPCHGNDGGSAIIGQCPVDEYCRITDFTTGAGTCHARGSAGQSCTYGDCAVGGGCATSTCIMGARLGEACPNCIGTCVGGVCRPGVCY